MQNHNFLLWNLLWNLFQKSLRKFSFAETYFSLIWSLIFRCRIILIITIIINAFCQWPRQCHASQYNSLGLAALRSASSTIVETNLSLRSFSGIAARSQTDVSLRPIPTRFLWSGLRPHSPRSLRSHNLTIKFQGWLAPTALFPSSQSS